MMLTSHRFSIDEYDGIVAAGVLHEDEPVELIEGDIVRMAPIGNRHATCVADLHEWLVMRLQGRALVRSQSPIRLPPLSEPEPDLVILRPRADRYWTSHPGPDDILLLIEVADSSLAYDRDYKLPLYAAARIPEVWLVDLPGDRVTAHLSPRRGRYRQTVTVKRGATLSPAAFPDLVLSIDDILGPAA